MIKVDVQRSSMKERGWMPYGGLYWLDREAAKEQNQPAIKRIPSKLIYNVSRFYREHFTLLFS